MKEVASLMFQVPNGGGYSMSLNEVMELDVNWKNFLLYQLEEWFEKYNQDVNNE